MKAAKAKKKIKSPKAEKPAEAPTDEIMLKIGDKAPAFQLKSDEGKDISLDDLYGKAVVLYFYPRAMTPGCTIEAKDFRDLKPQFDKAGAVILGCSGDTVESQAKFH